MKEAGPECVVNLGSTEKAGAEIPVAADPPDSIFLWKSGFGLFFVQH